MTEAYISALSDKELRDKLLNYGVSVGPVTGSSRRVLEKKLGRLLAGTDSTSSQKTPRSPTQNSTPVSKSPSFHRLAVFPPGESKGSNTTSQTRNSGMYSSLRGNTSSDTTTPSRKSLSSSYNGSRKFDFPSLNSTVADRFNQIVVDAVYGDSPRFTENSTIRSRFKQTSPLSSYKKKITTTPPLQRYSTRYLESERPPVDFQENQYEEDDHMEWSRELSDAESRRYDCDGLRSNNLSRTTTFDTSFLRNGRATAQVQSFKNWYAKNEIVVTAVIFSALILLTVGAVIHRYPEQIQSCISHVSDFFSSLFLVGVHYAIVPAAIITLVVAVLVGIFYGYRYKTQTDKKYAKEKQELIEKIICKVHTSAPDPVAINQLRDDLFPVYKRTKYEEKLWNECENVLLQKDSRIRCDLHRTKEGDTVTVFRWIGTNY